MYIPHTVQNYVAMLTKHHKFNVLAEKLLQRPVNQR